MIDFIILKYIKISNNNNIFKKKYIYIIILFLIIIYFQNILPYKIKYINYLIIIYYLTNDIQIYIYLY